MNKGTPAWLERTELLFGDEKLARLRAAHVLVVGLGGVGAYAAEMICRAGVGRLTIADSDRVSPSNINRQLVALHSTVGREKSEVLAERLRDINSELELMAVTRYIRDEETDLLLDSARFDYVVDAIDTLSPKVALIKGALDRGLPLVSSMGAGAKTDPALVEICDIARTHHCPLAHMLRKRLHRIGIRTGFHAVFSPEPVRDGAMILSEETNKKSNVGTISYMPAVFGCACASVVVRGLIGEL
ncbi:MAG: tRNA threonylcarbamoyladenosine dehydratase [Rikenellaceae bacterium]|nr:tRNA threonylcarbamoyladenosine dehydratase [Rikenellaceae bacterium]MCL2692037.1 tRNA threonylcarbamoyladenosine dehydratase [Rikenellaceae bacterium]